MTFFQKSRLGRVFFEIKGSRVLLSGKVGFKQVALDASLDDIAPNFERLKWRIPALFFVPLSAAGFVLLLLHFLSFLPDGVHIILKIWGWILACGFAYTALRGLSPVEIARFHTKSGARLFDIVKEKAQAKDFEEFVGELTRLVIERQTKIPPNQALVPTPMSVTPAASAPVAPATGAAHL